MAAIKVNLNSLKEVSHAQNNKEGRSGGRRRDGGDDCRSTGKCGNRDAPSRHCSAADDRGGQKKGLTPESRKFRDKLAEIGVQSALKSKPASFYVPENSKLIRTGNLEDHLDHLKEVDWIIEVVVERLDIKKLVFEKIDSVLTPGTIITSNTSGIPGKAMVEGRSENFRKHFAITHFFNPPVT
jgi:hypothetical protein